MVEAGLARQNGFFAQAATKLGAVCLAPATLRQRQFTRSMQKSMTSSNASFHGEAGRGASASRAIMP